MITILLYPLSSIHQIIKFNEKKLKVLQHLPGDGIEASVIFGFENGGHLALSVADAAVDFYRCQFAIACQIPDRGLADAELGTYLFLGEQTVFLGLHVDGHKTLACSVDGVNHKLMQVGEGNIEDNIGRVGVGEGCLKKGI